MYNMETKRIIVSRDIIWVSFGRSDFNEGLDKILRLQTNDENKQTSVVNIKLSD